MKNPLRNEILGKELHSQRIKKKIKQQTVARKLNVSISYISKIENGKAPINAIAMILYCDAIGLSAADFLKSFLDALV